jgi:hypothetical protein
LPTLPTNKGGVESIGSIDTQPALPQTSPEYGLEHARYRPVPMRLCYDTRRGKPFRTSANSFDPVPGRVARRHTPVFCDPRFYAGTSKGEGLVRIVTCARLCGVSPPVTRRLLITEQASLAQFHAALQVAFGWSDEHLYCFQIRGGQFGDLARAIELALAGGGVDIPLAAFAFEINESFRYQYNLFVPWEINYRPQGEEGQKIGLSRPLMSKDPVLRSSSGSVAVPKTEGLPGWTKSNATRG